MVNAPPAATASMMAGFFQELNGFFMYSIVIRERGRGRGLPTDCKIGSAST